MVDLGYQEAVTYSFVDPAWERLFSPDGNPLTLANPISSELAVMRSSLWPGLVKALKYNLNRQQDRVRLFETGLRFVNQGNELKQEMVLSAVACGPAVPLQWGESGRQVDFFDLKGDLENILALSGGEGVLRPTAHRALHPGQSAEVSVNGVVCGWIGALHPELLARLDLDRAVYAMELDLETITCGFVPKFTEQSRFPAIRRDLAIVVDAACPADTILASIRAMRFHRCGNWLYLTYIRVKAYPMVEKVSL
jgi:phenylalanyl-tRNA synthetase beta chain